MRRTLLLVSSALVLALAVAPHVRIHVSLNDDAFITYRYARNLAEGDGLVFNEGERVLGTTTPGYAVTLAALGRVVGTEGIPTASRWLNLLALLAAGLVVGLEVARLSRQPLLGVAAAGVVTLAPHTLHSSLAGMEAPVFLLLVALALVGLVGDRPWTAVLAAGAAPLMRPEGVFVTALVGAVTLLKWRSRSPKLLPVLALPGAAWALMAWGWYGSALPHSVVAKRAGIYPLTAVDSTVGTLRLLSHGLVGLALPVPGNTLSWILAALLLGVLAAGGVRLARSHPGLWPVPVLLAVLLLFYATSRTVMFTHYLAFAEPLAYACAGGALFALLRRLPGREWALTVASLLLVARVLAVYPYRSVAAGEPVPGETLFSPSTPRQAVYRTLGQALAQVVPPGTTVALPEIGELGWYMPQLRVLDAGGLVSPEAIPHLPVPPEQRAGPEFAVVPPGLLRSEEPELVVALEIFLRHGAAEDPFFQERYREVVDLTGGWLPWGSGGLRVYARQDVPTEGYAEAIQRGFGGS